MKDFLNFIDGRKTYIAAGVGILAALVPATAVLPILGATFAVGKVVALVSSAVVIYGRLDANRKIEEAFQSGKVIGKELK